MLRCVVLMSILSWATCQKRSGPYYLEYQFLGRPLPDNNIVHYHFQLSRINKYEIQMTGWIKFLKKVIDFRIYLKLFVRTVAGYRSDSPPPISKSFCFEPILMFPVLQDSFSGTIDQKDCSVEKGDYVLRPYSIEKELRRFVGNETHYGDFIARMVWLEGNNEILGVDIAYSIKNSKWRYHTGRHHVEQNEE